jgi:hypothetical protein
MVRASGPRPLVGVRGLEIWTLVKRYGSPPAFGCQRDASRHGYDDAGNPSFLLGARDLPCCFSGSSVGAFARVERCIGFRTIMFPRFKFCLPLASPESLSVSEDGQAAHGNVDT